MILRQKKDVFETKKKGKEKKTNLRQKRLFRDKKKKKK